MAAPSPLHRFLAAFAETLQQGTLTKLTLGKPRPSADPTLRNIVARLVALKAGPHLTLVYRHATRDITKNLPLAEAPATIASLLADTFLDAHLFTSLNHSQLEQSLDPAQRDRLHVKSIPTPAAPPLAPIATHDRAKSRLIPADTAWLRAMGITNDRGQPRDGMAHKFRQIEKFAELLQSLLNESGLAPTVRELALLPPLRIADMGAGKGYLTFALASLLGPQAHITGIERRPDLVTQGNRLAQQCGFASHLTFTEGDIQATAPTATPQLDVLLALHACDTATDDALAAGHAAGARLLVVSPCCQKELRPQLTAPIVMAQALRHGIFQERQAEFVTDALRAQLLEAAGYHTKVFEFISSEHTAKNIMITAYRPHNATQDPLPGPTQAARSFAAFFGIREHRLAHHLGIRLH